MIESETRPVGTDRRMRADARRNYDRIVAVAVAAVAEHGADASLEEIARQAGVGSATLHRHFPTRRLLLEAVFHDRVLALCAHARELSRDADPGTALVVWLRAVGGHVATTRGLVSLLIHGVQVDDPAWGTSCYAMTGEAGSELLDRARKAGAVRPEVSIDDLLTLVNALSVVTEDHPDGAAEFDRLLTLALHGIQPDGVHPAG